MFTYEIKYSKECNGFCVFQVILFYEENIAGDFRDIECKIEPHIFVLYKSSFSKRSKVLTL